MGLHYSSYYTIIIILLLFYTCSCCYCHQPKAGCLPRKLPAGLGSETNQSLNGKGRGTLFIIIILDSIITTLQICSAEGKQLELLWSMGQYLLCKCVCQKQYLLWQLITSNHACMEVLRLNHMSILKIYMNCYVHVQYLHMYIICSEMHASKT